MLSYVYTSDGNLNPRAKKGIFTDYPEGIKGNKIWILEDQKCITSRNVNFREEVVFMTLKHESEDSSILDGQLLPSRFLAVEMPSPREEEEPVNLG